MTADRSWPQHRDAKNLAGEEVWKVEDCPVRRPNVSVYEKNKDSVGRAEEVGCRDPDRARCCVARGVEGWGWKRARRKAG